MLTLIHHSRMLMIEQIMVLIGRAHRQPRRLRNALERLPADRLRAAHRRMLERLDNAFNSQV